MYHARVLTLVAGLLVLSAGLTEVAGQEKGKKDEPTGKIKGQLPQGWGKIGLTDDQKQKVYKIQAKYNEQIDKLEAEIKDLKEKRDKERYEILTAEQKKRLKDASDKSPKDK